MNIVSLLSNTINEFRTKTAILEDGKTISYQNLWDSIERLSAAFYKIGIREKHKVALFLPNSSDFIFCFFALLKINAVVSPLSPDLTPAELKSTFNNLNPHAIISSVIFIENIRKKNPFLLDGKILVLKGNAKAELRIEHGYELERLYDMTESCTFGALTTYAEHPAVINYTYRGFGGPLGAVFSHKAYATGVSAYIAGTSMCSRQRVLSLLPLHHFYPLVGCVVAPLISGATVIISKNYMPRSILQVIDTFKVDRLTAVPSIYALLLQHYKTDEYELNSLACCITGGAYMPIDKQEAIRKKMRLEVLQGYGLTECFVATWNRWECNQPGTLGLPFTPDIKIKIADDNGVSLAKNQVGEILIDTPSVMQGYYNQQEETRRVLKDGWLYTGDYGFLDDKGYLHFAGLKKNVAKVGGNMVDLKEVEDVLLSHPLISAARVFAEEDALWGHIVAAEIFLRKEGKSVEKDIKALCEEKLSRFKIPRTMRLTSC